MSTNTIELNGKRYDAVIGALLDADGSSHTVSSTRLVPTPVDGHSSVGSHPAKHHHASPRPAHRPVQPAIHKSAAPAPHSDPVGAKTMRDVMRPAPNLAKSHKPSKSQTLMRRSVAKPSPASLKARTHVQQRTDALIQQPSINVLPKMSSYHIDERRSTRARLTPHSPQVSRYAAAGEPKPANAYPSLQPTKPMQTMHPHPRAGTMTDVVAPKPHVGSVHTSKASQAASTDIFEQALARATSHQEPLHPHPKSRRRRGIKGKRALSIGAGTLACAILLGFFAWQNSARLTIHYADHKAGVAATLPAYQPTGYKIGRLSYSPGIVAVNFSNSASGDTFDIVQRPTTWDSRSLRDGFVALQDKAYKTIQGAGQTIYTYGNNNASWVSNGIWYQVNNNNGNLSPQQLISLASSM